MIYLLTNHLQLTYLLTYSYVVSSKQKYLRIVKILYKRGRHKRGTVRTERQRNSKVYNSRPKVGTGNVLICIVVHTRSVLLP